MVCVHRPTTLPGVGQIHPLTTMYLIGQMSLMGCLLTDFKLDQLGGSFGNFPLYYKNGSEDILDNKINLAVAESAFIFTLQW